jgi:hypothetical protein
MRTTIFTLIVLGFVIIARGDVPDSPDQAAKLLERRFDLSVKGLYELDNEYSFNVIDTVFYDTASGQISLSGHYDERFRGLRVPYLQHLATLLEAEKPRFSLEWTPDSQQRVDALFHRTTLSTEEEARMIAQVTEVFDANRLLQNRVIFA